MSEQEATDYSGESMIHARHFLAALQVAESLQCQPRWILKQAEIKEDWLKHPYNRLPTEYFLRLVDTIQKQSEEKCLGMLIGKVIASANVNLRQHLSIVSRNFRDYLNQYPSLMKLIGDVGQLRARNFGRFTEVSWDIDNDALRNHPVLVDIVLSNAIHVANYACVRPFIVTKCFLPYSSQHFDEEKKYVFGSNIQFDAQYAAFRFPTRVLRTAVIHLDEQLLQEEPLEKLFGANHPMDPFMRDLRDSIIRLLSSGEMRIDEVAKEMGVSRRTLQRRLHDNNQQFINVVQNVRQSQAVRFLTDSRLNISEIAFLLGYSSQATFSTAFKGWKGCTPSEFRNNSS